MGSQRVGLDGVTFSFTLWSTALLLWSLPIDFFARFPAQVGRGRSRPFLGDSLRKGEPWSIRLFSVAQSCPTHCADPMDCSIARLPCPSKSPRACSSSWPSSRWFHPAISSSVVSSSCLQSFPTSGSFQMSQLFASGGQSIGASASVSVLPMNSGLISFRIDWFDLLAVQGTLKSLLQHHSSKTSILWCSAFFMVQLSHPHMTTGKTIALTRWTFVGKVMSLLFNTLTRFVIAFLPRSKCLLIS